MAGIYHQVGVKTDFSKAYNAITTLQGLSNWWAPTTGETDEGDTLCFHFGEHTVEMTVQESTPDKKIVWQCAEKEGEWKDTIITFDLSETGEQIFINFSHTNWAQQTAFCAHCSTKWAVFMLSLKDYLETGKGRPFPDDIQINHMVM
ncbi:MAG: SRPBCC domain-containing protein [Gammaproteobacteria bacterium]